MRKIWMVEEKAPNKRTWRSLEFGPYATRREAEDMASRLGGGTNYRYRTVQYARVGGEVPEADHGGDHKASDGELMLAVWPQALVTEKKP